MHDAIVIGAGPNGLVAANLLADAGWDVLVLEAQPQPGGAVRSAELTEPGFVSDVFSAFYPMAAASPVLRSLELERHGLTWCRSPIAFAHPTPDGRCAAAYTGDVAATARTLDDYAAGDGEAFAELYDLWERLGPPLLAALLTPFPPLRASGRLAAALGPSELLRFVRFGMLPVRRLADELFDGTGAGNWFAGNALHGDFQPESPGSALFGLLLGCLGQQIGYPVPQGGAGELTDALVRRLESRGGRIQCNAEVTEIVLEGGRRATGVRLADGSGLHARRAVLADVNAPALYLKLIGEAALPVRMRNDLRRFQWDNATVKVDWSLDAPIGWTAEAARSAGTIHVADDMDALSRHAFELVTRQWPAEPYLVMGQYSMVDATRIPAGREVAWAYTHVPQELEGDAAGELPPTWDEATVSRFADRIEEQVERLAGFRGQIRSRHILGPEQLEQRNSNLQLGALNGGTAQIHQQLVFRPTPGLGRAETPFDGLYLASMSAHPGGGVHGAPGANAARAALAAASRLGRPGARARVALTRALAR